MKILKNLKISQYTEKKKRFVKDYATIEWEATVLMHAFNRSSSV